MKRGELWTVIGSSYASKPRPVLVVQNDQVNCFDSTILCLITSHNSEAFPTRVLIEPNESNGLKERSWVMTDKIYAAHADELGYRIGVLTDDQMQEVSRKLALLLDLNLKG